MTQTLQTYSAPALKDWGKVVALTLGGKGRNKGVSAFGGCNQGLGNGSEGCDPGNSNNNQPSNDESGGTPGNGGRGGRNR